MWGLPGVTQETHIMRRPKESSDASGEKGRMLAVSTRYPKRGLLAESVLFAGTYADADTRFQV
jgi:hypothetical protein